MQLVAYGSENLYINGNPQITFFKTVFKRHTNFATEYISQEFKTLPTFSTNSNSISKVKIERNGDLLSDIYLVYDLPAIYSTEELGFKWVKNIGQAIIYSIEINIAGQKIDIQYGQWMNIWSELTVPPGKIDSYNNLTGNISQLYNPSIYYGSISETNIPTIPKTRLYIPIDFWFCTNPGLSIPLIALQYTEIEIVVEFNPLNNLFTIKDTNGTDVSINTFNSNSENKDIDPNFTNSFWYFVNGGTTNTGWTQNTYLEVNYVYLDDDERKHFALTSHEYLIKQVHQQKFDGLKDNETIELNIQHPVIEFMWVYQRDDAYLYNDWTNYTNILPNENMTTESSSTPIINRSDYNNFLSKKTEIFNNYYDIMYTAKFIFNGKDRFSEKDFTFFNKLIPYKCHSRSPNTGIYVYSFAINPEEYQPSGSCNFSRINKAQLQTVLRNSTKENGEFIYYNQYLYTINYNVLRIMGGIGSIVFAN